MKFKLHSNYQPRGDQPAAIDQLFSGVDAGEKHQVLLGVTAAVTVFNLVASATYTYPITEWLSATASYNFSYRLAGDAVIRNVVSIGLTATYPIRLY